MLGEPGDQGGLGGVAGTDGVDHRDRHRVIAARPCPCHPTALSVPRLREAAPAGAFAANGAACLLDLDGVVIDGSCGLGRLAARPAAVAEALDRDRSARRSGGSGPAPAESIRPPSDRSTRVPA